MKSTNDPLFIRFTAPVNFAGLHFKVGASLVIVPSLDPALMPLEGFCWKKVEGESPSDEQISEMEVRHGLK